MSFDRETFVIIKNKTKTKYYKVGVIQNKALNAKIFFSANGLHHLRYNTNRSERNKKV